jgi:cell fate (sporulation/competence/biofilm development) regulator YmcA (YheA/YmcA/DUF963 family)
VRCKKEQMSFRKVKRTREIKAVRKREINYENIGKMIEMQEMIELREMNKKLLKKIKKTEEINEMKQIKKVIRN